MCALALRELLEKVWEIMRQPNEQQDGAPAQSLLSHPQRTILRACRPATGATDSGNKADAGINGQGVGAGGSKLTNVEGLESVGDGARNVQQQHISSAVVEQ